MAKPKCNDFFIENLAYSRYSSEMKQYAVTTLLGLLVLTVAQFITLSPTSEKLRMYFLDVGQGDSIFLRFSTGENFLVDTGVDSAVFRELDRVLPWYDKSIDYVLLTHGDLDHVGAMLDILDRYKVEKIFVSPVFGRIEVEQQISEKAKSLGTEIVVLKKGDTVTFGTRIANTLQILHPDENCFAILNDENECSLVGLLTHGSHTFLLTGDVGEKVEPQIAQQIENPVTVLKVGHHGSRESSSAAFLEKTRPQYSIISAGRDNSYGHPHKETIERLLNASSTIFSTKEDATIVASSDGTNLEVKKLFDQTSLFQSGICSVLLYGFDASC
jgi:competence protein ComEC